MTLGWLHRDYAERQNTIRRRSYRCTLRKDDSRPLVQLVAISFRGRNGRARQCRYDGGGISRTVFSNLVLRLMYRKYSDYRCGIAQKPWA